MSLVINYNQGENPTSKKHQVLFDQTAEQLHNLENNIGDISNENKAETGDYTRNEVAYIANLASSIGGMNKIEPYLNSMSACRWDPLFGYLIKDYKYNVYPAVDQTIKCGVGCRYDCVAANSQYCSLGYSLLDRYKEIRHTNTNLCTNTNCPHFSGNITEAKYLTKPYSLKPLVCSDVTNMSFEFSNLLPPGMYYARIQSWDIILGWQTLAHHNLVNYADGVELSYDTPITLLIVTSVNLPAAILTIVTDTKTVYCKIPAINAGSYRYYISDDGSLFTLGITNLANSTFTESHLYSASDEANRYKMGRRLYRILPPVESREVILPAIVAKDDFAINSNSTHILQGIQTLFENNNNVTDGTFGITHSSEILLGYAGLNTASDYALIVTTSSNSLDFNAQAIQIYDPLDKVNTLQTLETSQLTTFGPHTYLYDLSSYKTAYSSGSLVVSVVSLFNSANISKIYVIEMQQAYHNNYDETLGLPDILNSLTTRELPMDYIFIQESDGFKTICNTTNLLTEGIDNNCAGSITFYAGWYNTIITSSPNCLDFEYYNSSALDTENQKYHLVCTNTPLSLVLGDLLNAYWNHITDPLIHMSKDRICNYIKNPYICCDDVGQLEFQVSDNLVDVGEDVTFTATIDLNLLGEDINTTYYISFGDGSNFVIPNTDGIGTTTYKYSKSGIYKPSVRAVIDKPGICDKIIVGNDIVVSLAPKVLTTNFITQARDENFATVAFTSTVTGGTGGLKYMWDFGDGGFSFTQNPTHIFAVNRSYNIILTIEDANLLTSIYNVGTLWF